VLLKGLPPDSAFKAEMAAAAEKANKPSLDRLRERQTYYNQREGATT
jgi:hypothetical protein